MKRLLLLGVCLAFAASAFSQNAFKQELIHSSVVFPAKPTQKIDSGVYVYTLSNDSARYTAMVVQGVYHDRRDVDTLYSGYVSSTLDAVKHHKLIYKKNVNIQDFKGIEMEYYDYDSPSGLRVIYQRIVCFDENLYCLIFSTPFDDSKSIVAARQKFLTSLVIK